MICFSCLQLWDGSHFPFIYIYIFFNIYIYIYYLFNGSDMKSNSCKLYVLKSCKSSFKLIRFLINTFSLSQKHKLNTVRMFVFFLVCLFVFFFLRYAGFSTNALCNTHTNKLRMYPFVSSLINEAKHEYNDKSYQASSKPNPTPS